MKAMLEPSMVAASTQAFALSGQGLSAIPDRITASSHGCLILNLDARKAQSIPVFPRD
jgi:hypothetical protein